MLFFRKKLQIELDIYVNVGMKWHRLGLGEARSSLNGQYTTGYTSNCFPVYLCVVMLNSRLTPA